LPQFPVLSQAQAQFMMWQTAPGVLRVLAGFAVWGGWDQQAFRIIQHIKITGFV